MNIAIILNTGESFCYDDFISIRKNYNSFGEEYYAVIVGDVYYEYDAKAVHKVIIRAEDYNEN